MNEKTKKNKNQNKNKLPNDDVQQTIHFDCFIRVNNKLIFQLKLVEMVRRERGAMSFQKFKIQLLLQYHSVEITKSSLNLLFLSKMQRIYILYM